MNGRRPKLAEWWKGALEKYKYALLIVAAGVALMLLPAGGCWPRTRSGTGKGARQSPP